MNIPIPLSADAAPLPEAGFDWVLTLASCAAVAWLLSIVSLVLCLRHRHRPRVRAYVLAASLLVLLSLALQWGVRVVTEGWTHPEPVFEAPWSECRAAGIPVEETGFNALGYRCPAVADFAMARGVPPQEAPCIVCMRGTRLLALEPVQWHGVKVNISIEKADPDRVYFYRIHPRYVSAWGP